MTSSKETRNQYDVLIKYLLGYNLIPALRIDPLYHHDLNVLASPAQVQTVVLLFSLSSPI